MITLSRPDEEHFSFTSDKNTLLQLRKRPWGTYILGSWFDDDGVNLTGGGTDMEYVFRAGDSADALYFSGGNHGDEELLGIAFFAPDGRQIKAEENEKYEYISVIQKTRLYCSLNPDKIDYTNSDWPKAQKHYCEVTRTYKISDTQIALAVDFNFVRDCYIGLSYTAMFPILKTRGQNCEFYNGDTLLTTVETSLVGKPDYSGPFLGKTNADRVLIWGADAPERKVEVRIYTPEDSADLFRGSHKTFFWDMNKTHNKLYFSRSSLDAPQLTAACTKWHTATTWTLLKDNK